MEAFWSEAEKPSRKLSGEESRGEFLRPDKLSGWRKGDLASWRVLLSRIRNSAGYMKVLKSFVIRILSQVSSFTVS